MEKQQTAVEWLEDRINIGLTYEQQVLFEAAFNQAKQMEREQIETAFQEGKWNGWEAAKDLKDLIDSIEYYTQTYGE